MMFNKIDLSHILTSHLKTLKDNDTGKTDIWDILLYYALPFVGVFIAYLFPITQSFANVLLTFFSIFSALLLSLLVLAIDATRKAKDRPQPGSPRLLGFFREVFYNISYSILIAVIGIVTLLIPFLLSQADYEKHVRLPFIVGAIAYYVLIHFILLILTILKRMNVVFETTMNDEES